MEQYIPKSALVAEIKNLMNRYDSEYDKDSTEVKAAKGNVCHEILCTIDNLEVKEVDFEKELDRIWFDNKFCNMFDNSAVDFANVREICRHFYELGLKTQKGE